MVGDGIDSLDWLRWLSPFGLTTLVRPFDADRVLPLVVLASAAAAVALAAVAVAARRDLRGGWVAPAAGRRSHLALLGSVPAFALRRLLGPLAGWFVGIGAYYLLIGALTVSVTAFLTANARFAALAADAGFTGLGRVEGFAATLFALPVGVFAATRIGALAADETARRLTLLLAGPLRPTRLLGAHVAVTAGGAVVLAAGAGLAMWAGAALVGAPPRPRSGPVGRAQRRAGGGAVPGGGGAGVRLGAVGGRRGRVAAGGGRVPAAGARRVGGCAGLGGGAVAVHAPRPGPAGRSGPRGLGALLAVAAVLGGVGVLGLRRRDLSG